jgi:hypothetical protein
LPTKARGQEHKRHTADTQEAQKSFRPRILLCFCGLFVRLCSGSLWAKLERRGIGPERIAQDAKQSLPWRCTDHDVRTDARTRIDQDIFRDNVLPLRVHGHFPGPIRSGASGVFVYVIQRKLVPARTDQWLGKASQLFALTTLVALYAILTHPLSLEGSIRNYYTLALIYAAIGIVGPRFRSERREYVRTSATWHSILT